jgi:hypothetical protein
MAAWDLGPYVEFVVDLTLAQRVECDSHACPSPPLEQHHRKNARVQKRPLSFLHSHSFISARHTRYQVPGTGTVRVHSCPAWQRLQTPEAMSEAEEAKNVQDGEEEEDEVAVVKEEESTAVFEPVVRLSMSTVLSFFVLLQSF